MIEEEDFNEMERVKRRAKKILRSNQYRGQKVACCSTCEHVIRGYPEEELICGLAKQEGWLFGTVQDLDICDRYTEASQ